MTVFPPVESGWELCMQLQAMTLWEMECPLTPFPLPAGCSVGGVAKLSDCLGDVEGLQTTRWKEPGPPAQGDPM